VALIRDALFAVKGGYQARWCFQALAIGRGGSDEGCSRGFLLAGELGGFCEVWDCEEVSQPQPGTAADAG
jgi:hypothetical protein